MLMPKWRYIGIAIGCIVSIHLLLSIHPTYRATTSPYRFLPQTSSNEIISGLPPESAVPDVSIQLPTADDLRGADLSSRPRANAVFVVLARNSDLWPLLESIRQMEDRFNHWAKYDYVFLNEEEFSEEFKRYTQSLTSSNCYYGLIPADVWFQPDWIDEEKAKAAREEMIRKKVIYGHSVPYRNMCRFQSGNFFRHELLAKYDYYWRIEPSVKYFCDLNYDPFLVMQNEKKVYGFTLSLYEYIETIPTLWDSVKEFIALHPEYVAADNAMGFLSQDGGETYNKCHFWSNFEIGDLNFYRSQAYLDYFDFLDKKGGFYYERWGDAPIHSIAAALFANKSQLHWFQDIGYRHEPFQHCPQGEAHTRGKCWCDQQNNFDFEWYSCTNKYTALFQ
ncbi:putative alpha-1,2-mannosyltransferase [Kockovaella imperatae]|uniref:Putative alpha-1,2-mannosyltransferase n=1 Tax=Kockovaella imperatae TaxID=4999 RepID=A0A1Y1UPN7_9TREE|nr:putative alpha-1,2-mannosyltransferase [Kockovaella imperatae]ORX39932.1 putative alpha-1,2-mannosyltransferase [Kockovaella imperatae]